MDEGTGSKHAIVCDIVKKYVTLKGLGRTSACKQTIDFIITKPIFKSMDKLKLITPGIIGWIGVSSRWNNNCGYHCSLL